MKGIEALLFRPKPRPRQQQGGQVLAHLAQPDCCLIIEKVRRRAARAIPGQRLDMRGEGGAEGPSFAICRCRSTRIHRRQHRGRGLAPSSTTLHTQPGADHRAGQAVHLEMRCLAFAAPLQDRAPGQFGEGLCHLALGPEYGPEVVGDGLIVLMLGILHAHRLALVDEHRIAGDDQEIGETR